MTLYATMRREYSMSDDEFFFECPPTRVNALFAALCEHYGMEGMETYRNKDILARLREESSL